MRVVKNTFAGLLLVGLLSPAWADDSAGNGSGIISSRPLMGSTVDTSPKWGKAITQSFGFLAIQHSVRLTQTKTRREFSGKFFEKYTQSITGISGWGDGDGIITNYVGHPMQGAVAGYIYIQNDPRAMLEEFSSSPAYWKSRLRAFGWSAAYSTQFEIGPVSEATIGHVGRQNGTAGAVDLVMTPTGGFGFIVAEDAVDRYLISKWEQRASSNMARILIRSCLNPNRSFANLLRLRAPWHRDTRPGITEILNR